MKYLLAVLFATAPLPLAYGQGQIYFRNYVPGLFDARVFDVDCRTLLEGSAYLGQVYEGATPSNLAPLGPALPFGTGLLAGVFASGLGEGVTVPSGDPTSEVYVQLRAWQASAGVTYDSAASAGGTHGFSNIVPVFPSIEATPLLIGLQRFCLVPEPSALALALVSTVVLGVGFVQRRRL